MRLVELPTTMFERSTSNKTALLLLFTAHHSTSTTKLWNIIDLVRLRCPRPNHSSVDQNEDGGSRFIGPWVAVFVASIRPRARRVRFCWKFKNYKASYFLLYQDSRFRACSSCTELLLRSFILLYVYFQNQFALLEPVRTNSFCYFTELNTVPQMHFDIFLQVSPASCFFSLGFN